MAAAKPKQKLTTAKASKQAPKYAHDTSVWDMLKSLAGTVDGLSDLCVEHDHYPINPGN